MAVSAHWGLLEGKGGHIRAILGYIGTWMYDWWLAHSYLLPGSSNVVTAGSRIEGCLDPTST